MRKIRLACGCCGIGFRAWDGYKDQDQDKGYGICRDCQIDDAWRDYEQMSGLIADVSAALGPVNKILFQSYDRPLQDAIIYQMLEDGIITFQFNRTAA